VLDPFCGTGVVLQEAALMGYDTAGTDLEPRMIEYTQTNMTWLSDMYQDEFKLQLLDSGDATVYQWKEPIDFVASEVYLGRPFTSTPTPEILAQTMSDCNLILKKFLRNIETQLASGTRLCLAVPAWKQGKGQFKHLPLIDQISDLGYNRMSFEHIRDEDLIYCRDDQIVARQLIVITRK